jgi:pimeloyl-ACP methyl ester carboxylesterase
MTLLCMLSTIGPAAQDRPVVFLHGLGSSPETWQATANRLQAALAIQPAVPGLSSRAVYESQAAEVQNGLHGLADNTVAIGHSNGGIVARQWSQGHALSGVVTLGTPHRGAPLVQNLRSYAGFTYQLQSAIASVYGAFSAGCCDYYFLLAAYHPYWGFAYDFAAAAVREVAASVGLSTLVPVSSQMVPGSSYLSGLNATWNLDREAASIPARVGIVSVAHNFYWGGPLRTAFPDWGDALALLRDIARWTMVSSANYLYAVAPPGDFWARETAGRLMNGSFYLLLQDEWWCQAVSMPGFGQCWQNDTVVPVWSQAYPGGLSLLASFDGPAHTQETRMSDAILQSVLMYYVSIPPRQPPPPPPPAGRATVYEHILFEGESFVADLDMSFVGWEWNDRLSSVHVPSGRTVVLYEHADYQGESATLTSDAADLRDYPGPGIDGTWNDVVSSIQVH